MKFKILFFAFFAFFAFGLQAQTIISDKEEISGKWTKKKSPYIIEGEAIIPKGKTLKIKPGVTVLLKTGKQNYLFDYQSSTGKYVKRNDFDMGFIRVNGTLIAKGKKKKKITFTRKESSGHWGVIFFNSKNKGNLMSYCVVEHAYYINYILEKGTSAEGSVVFSDATGTVTNCIVKENSTSAGIISINDSQPVIKNNIVDNCFYGISLGHGALPTITNNVCSNNYIGMRAYYCEPIVVTNNTFINNRQSSLKLQTMVLAVKNCIFSDETLATEYGDENKLTISYSLIANKTEDGFINYSTKNIFNQNPLFVNKKKNDLNISSSSPAKGKGENGVDIGAKIGFKFE